MWTLPVDVAKRVETPREVLSVPGRGRVRIARALKRT
jgi:hypothetical protein